MHQSRILFILLSLLFNLNSYAIWDGKTIVEPVADKNGYYIIDSESKFAALVQLTYLVEGWSRNKVFKQTCNLNFGNGVLSPIGDNEHPFEGEFDGQNFLINNLRIESSYDKGGLFLINKGRLSNIIMTDSCSVLSKSCAGSIAGENKGLIRNCNSRASLFVSTASGYLAYAGGIVGLNSDSGVIERSSFEGRFRSGMVSCMGGVAGVSTGIIRNCDNVHPYYFKLTNTSFPSVSFGAICGKSLGTIDSCSNHATLHINLFASYGISTRKANLSVTLGGIAGYSSGSVNECVNNDSLVIILKNNTGESWGTSTIISCANCDTIVNRVGGIVGLNKGAVTLCRNTASAIMSRSYPVFMNDCTQRMYSGGICGLNDGVIAGCENMPSNAAKSNLYAESYYKMMSEVSRVTLTGTYFGRTMYNGGVAGYNSKKGVVTFCRNSMKINTDIYYDDYYNVFTSLGCGGLIGGNAGAVNSSYSYGAIYLCPRVRSLAVSDWDSRWTGVLESSITQFYGGAVGVNEKTGILNGVYYDQSTSRASGNIKGIGAATVLLQGKSVVDLMNNGGANYPYQWIAVSGDYPSLQRREVPSIIKDVEKNVSFFGSNRSLIIRSDKAIYHVPVFNLHGELVRYIDVNAGNKTIGGFTPGLYIINHQKVVVKE